MTIEDRHGATLTSGFDVDDASLTRFDLVREGARRDGVEIAHYAPRFPVAGTKVEKRVVRSIALMFALSGLFGFAFFVAFIWLPVGFRPGLNETKLYTPALGLTLGLSLAFLGFGVVTWAKKLLPDEVAIQERHDGASPPDEQRLTGAALANMVDETGIQRRPLLKAALLLPVGGLGLAAGTAVVGALIKDPNNPPLLLQTGWDPKNNDGRKVRLVREDGAPVRPEDVSVGGQLTVFPGIPGGTTNEWADSPVLLIHLRIQDADRLRASISASEAQVAAKKSADPDYTPPSDKKPVNGMWENFVAYSKICTHAGCPASLYEQQTNRLLCPCHQSQFSIIDQAKPIFGPATRRLPMLPLELEDGFLVAASDFTEAIGPAYWERP